MLDAEVTRISTDKENTALVEHIRISSKTLSDSNRSTSFRLKPYDAYFDQAYTLVERRREY